MVNEFGLVVPDSMVRWLREAPPSPGEQPYYGLLATKSSNLVSKAYRSLRKQQLAYSLFRQGKSGFSRMEWLYRQTRMWYDWKSHDLPYDV